MDESKVESVASRQKWKRPVAYLLLALGALATFFSGEIGRNLEIDITFIQFGALFLILAGAVLFLAVRASSDRVGAYTELFRRAESEADAPK